MRSVKSNHKAINILTKAAAVIVAALCLVFLFEMNAAKAADETTFTETNTEVTVSLVTDKTVYEAGDVINFTLTVENNRAHFYTSKAQFAYDITEGLETADGSELDNMIPKLESGEKAEIKGALVGNAAIFPAVEKPAEDKPAEADDEKSGSPNLWLIICIAAAAVVVIIVIILVLRKSRKGGPAWIRLSPWQ